MKFLLPLIAASLLTAGFYYSSLRVDRTAPETTQPAPSTAQVPADVQEGGIAFEDMTIPYLRSRQYESNLGDRRLYSSAGNYDAYLTSYNSDGLKVNGLLTIPKGEAPAGGWPAVVFVHGYIAPTVYRTTEKYTDYVNYLARNGLVVFKIDLRGHGESEGEPGGSYYSSDYIVDTLNARAALAASGFVNPNGIGLWGHSMAGNVTFRSFVAAADIPALVVWGGAGYTYEDLRKYGIDDNSYRPPSTSTQRQRRREELRRLYGDYNPESDFWRKVSPLFHLDGVNGAIQIHHAVDDTVVNVGYARDLMVKLDGTSIPHELFEYSSGGHNVTGASFSSAMQRTVEFYKNNLIR